ncbi:MAG: hypothetical protein DIU80_025045 [Chloroflexota bacterium]|nr:MAG: hypothetical protein DIU80_14360 [Chloroflexota bacterium]
MFRRKMAPSADTSAPMPGVLDQAKVVLRVETLPFWLFWQNLLALRPWWPVVVPFLIWYARRSYRRERAKLRGEPAR